MSERQVRAPYRGAPFCAKNTAVTYCDACGSTYPTVEHGKTCPRCGSDKTWLQTGNEVNIREISVL